MLPNVNVSRRKFHVKSGELNTFCALRHDSVATWDGRSKKNRKVRRSQPLKCNFRVRGENYFIFFRLISCCLFNGFWVMLQTKKIIIKFVKQLFSTSLSLSLLQLDTFHILLKIYLHRKFGIARSSREKSTAFSSHQVCTTIL